MKTQVHITEIENGWLVTMPSVSVTIAPQMAQAIEAGQIPCPTSQTYCKTIEELTNFLDTNLR